MLRVMPIALLFFFSLLAVSVQAGIKVGEILPSLSIEKYGELMLEGEDTIYYQPWNTAQLENKVQIIQYLAGRMGTRDMNKPFTDVLGVQDFSMDYHHTTTIINLDDTLFGTAGIVNSQLKKNKIKYWYSSIVADKKGEGASVWELEPKNSAIIILSSDYRVIFFKEGQLTEEEISFVVAMIEQQIEQVEAVAIEDELAQQKITE